MVRGLRRMTVGEGAQMERGAAGVELFVPVVLGGVAEEQCMATPRAKPADPSGQSRACRMISRFPKISCSVSSSASMVRIVRSIAVIFGLSTTWARKSELR
jgi:hypothetical protein